MCSKKNQKNYLLFLIEKFPQVFEISFLKKPTVQFTINHSN